VDKQRLAKLRARAEHLLDLFIALSERHAMLKPLAFDKALAERVGLGAPGRGQVILQNALLQHCVMDVVKLTVDSADRTPSVANIMLSLADEALRAKLREEYSVVPPPIVAGTDPLPADLVAEMAEVDRAELQARFDATWERLSNRWAALEGDGRLDGFKTWRDKLIAHSDLHHSHGEYQLTDLSALGLKWGDLGDLITHLREVISDIQTLTRAAGFAWEMLDEQLQAAADGFWGKLG